MLPFSNALFLFKPTFTLAFKAFSQRSGKNKALKSWPSEQAQTIEIGLEQAPFIVFVNFFPRLNM
jgi:hypothetical protein